MRIGSVKLILVTITVLGLGLATGLSSPGGWKVELPYAVTSAHLDGHDLVFVSETQLQRIAIFDVDLEENPVGYFSKPISDQRCDTNQKVNWTGFVYPRGIARDTQGNWYIGDARGLILKFDKGGNPDTKWDIALYAQAKPACGTKTFENKDGTILVGPQFDGAVDSIHYNAATHTLFVADAGNNRVVQINPDTAQLTDLKIPSLNYPMSVSTDILGMRLYVADSNNNRIVLWDLDKGQAVPNTFWNVISLSSYGITDCYKYVYVSDTFNDRVLIFESNGALVGKLGDVPTPVGIACDLSREAYVASFASDKLFQFKASP